MAKDDNNAAEHRLLSLPYPLWLFILQHLDVVSLCRLEQTCRDCRSRLKQPSVLTRLEDNNNNSDNHNHNETNKQGRQQDDDDHKDNKVSDTPSSERDPTTQQQQQQLSELIWKPLFDDRFPMHSATSQAEIDRNIHRYKALYHYRHERQVATYHILLNLLDVNDDNDESDDKERLWKIVVGHLRHVGRDGIYLFWQVWQGLDEDQAWPFTLPQGFEEELTQNQITVRKILARSFLRLLHCLSVAEEMLSLLMPRRRQMQHGNAPNNGNNSEPPPEISEESLAMDRFVANFGPQPNDPVVLEKLITLVSMPFFDMDPNRCNSNETTSQWIRQTLDDLADQVRQRVSSSSSVANSVGASSSNTLQQQQEKIRALHYVLFESDAPFVGDTQDYYNPRNMLLHTALRHRTGIPLILAVIYQAVAHRVGGLGAVEIVGLPGHIVVRIADLNQYVDVFSQGQLLTERECVEICQRHGLDRDDAQEFLRQVLIPEQVLQRQLNNLRRAFVNGTERHEMCLLGLDFLLKSPSFGHLEVLGSAWCSVWAQAHIRSPPTSPNWVEW